MKKMSTLGKVAIGTGVVAILAGVAGALFGKKDGPNEEGNVASEEESTEDEE